MEIMMTEIMYPAVKEGAIRLGLLCCSERVDLVKYRLPFLGRDPEVSADAEGLERWAQDGCDLVGRGDLLVVGVHEDAARDLEAVRAGRSRGAGRSGRQPRECSGRPLSVWQTRRGPRFVLNADRRIFPFNDRWHFPSIPT
jgi:hypothetical protein